MLFADANGIDRAGLRLVTYDGGGPTRNATAGGVVDIGLVGGQGFLPLAEKITPLLVFDAAKRDGWDCPTITEIAAGAEFVAGSQRGRRSDERRVGEEGVSTFRSRWSPYHSKKKQQQN